MIELWENGAGYLYLSDVSRGWVFADVEQDSAGTLLENMLQMHYDATEDWSLRCWDKDGSFYQWGRECAGPDGGTLLNDEDGYNRSPFESPGEMHQIATFDGETFTINVKSIGMAARRYLGIADTMENLGL